jgi:glycerol-3-phosphate O-acyltransferase/dihydroxyacetone phosphate acyltransferase
MIYNVLRFLTYFLLRVYYRKVYISNTALIPEDKPVILACNHPNTFMDAIVLSVLLKEPLYFLTRSDMFRSPLARWILNQMHLIPIYRLKEGAENLHKNKETFDRCFQILKNNGTVLIFSEGASVQEKRLRPLKKGTARLAFGAALEEGAPAPDLQVIPVGINYTHAPLFRKELMIGISAPIDVQQFRHTYTANPAKAFIYFNETLTMGLQQNIITIEEKSLAPLTERLFEIDRNNDMGFYGFGWREGDISRLRTEQAIASSVNHVAHYAPQILSELQQNVSQYFNLSGKLGLNDKELSKNRSSLWLILLIVLSFPLFATGYLSNYLPVWIAAYIARTKVKKVEYFSSVRMSSGFFLYLIYYPLVVLTALFLFSPIAAAATAFLLPICGYYSLFYLEWLRYARQAIKYQKIKNQQYEDIKNLAELRKIICEKIEALKKAPENISFQAQPVP